MRLWIFLIAMVISTFNYAHAGEGPEPALDITGTVVDWTGQIIRQYRHAEDTCFELQNPDNQPDKFKTCVFGYYDPVQFGNGKWLRVKGILQPENADVAAQVSGAEISLIQPPLPRRYEVDPWYNHGYDPFFRPYRYMYYYW